MRYLIDGYNFLFKACKSYKTLRAKKRQLLLSLGITAKERGLSLQVIFDGKHKDPGDPIRGNLGTLEIIYTGVHQSADAYLIATIEDAVRPGEYTVVSSDRAVLQGVRRGGGRAMTVEAFLALLGKKKPGKREPEKQEMRPSQGEFKRWLTLFEDRLK